MTLIPFAFGAILTIRQGEPGPALLGLALSALLVILPAVDRWFDARSTR